MPSQCSECQDHAEHKREKLKELCQAVITLYIAKDITGDGIAETFCNQAVRKVAGELGCHFFAPNDTANIMHDKMAKCWPNVSGFDATVHALHGGLAIASRKSAGHGHVAIVYPVAMGISPSLARSVPYVANVGKTNGLMKVSEAFSVKDGEPDYFLWIPTKS